MCVVVFFSHQDRIFNQPVKAMPVFSPLRADIKIVSNSKDTPISTSNPENSSFRLNRESFLGRKHFYNVNTKSKIALESQIVLLLLTSAIN